MITRYPSRGTVLVCVAFVLASIGLTTFVWRSVGGSVPLAAKSYEVTALFENASQLAPNADVRISGVNVGSVERVRQRGLRTEATLSIEARYAPLPRDVRAILRQKTLLGETFVALTPGSRTAPKLREGASIPVEQIEDTQPLDRVLATLDAEGRKQIREMLIDTGTMFDGRAGDLNNAFGNMGTGARQLEATMQILDGQRGAISTLTRETGKVLQTVGDERAAVHELVRAGDRVLSATASRDDALRATVRATPGLLRELGATSSAVERSAKVAAPALRAFRPVAPKVRPVLEVVNESSPEVEALLADFGRLAPLAQRALPAAGSLVSKLSPFMDALEPTARNIAPVIAYVAAYRRELVGAAANVGAATMGKAPGVSGRPTAYLRTIVPMNPEGFVVRSERVPNNRHAAYMAPGGLDRLKEGFLSASCEHAAPSEIPAPPCKEQGGWSFAGSEPRYFHRLTDSPPDGTAAVRRALGVG
jgi:phospholipid/cholesterol/gamma-HCH transport system substrate-binding protein